MVLCLFCFLDFVWGFHVFFFGVLFSFFPLSPLFDFFGGFVWDFCLRFWLGFPTPLLGVLFVSCSFLEDYPK